MLRLFRWLARLFRPCPNRAGHALANVVGRRRYQCQTCGRVWEDGREIVAG